MPTVNCWPSDSGLLATHGPILSVMAFAWTDDRKGRTVRSLNALIDTGATRSVIDDAIAKSMGLPIIGTHRFRGVSGIDTGTVYLTTVLVSQLNHVIHEPLGGVDLSDAEYQLLLGRDFLQHFVLIYDGRIGITIVSNDVPSVLAETIAKGIQQPE